MPNAKVYQHRFGSLITAYERIGYVRKNWCGLKRRLDTQYKETVALATEAVESMGAKARWDAATQLLHVNEELCIAILVCRHRLTEGGLSRWVIRFPEGAKPDITMVVRMNSANQGVRDYYLLPALDIQCDELLLGEENGMHLDSYRFETLDYLWRLIERVRVKEAA